ncbi:hypothetical protein K493DRAFT_301190, partial [Basidiobolus meristosporus CBS 931.73]
MLTKLELLPNLAASGVLYERSFKFFQDMAGNARNEKYWLSENIPGLLPSSKNPISVLSVGCGDGNGELDLLALLANRWKKVVYHGVEPNALHKSQFLKNLESKFCNTEHKVLNEDGSVAGFQTSSLEISLFN